MKWYFWLLILVVAIIVTAILVRRSMKTDPASGLSDDTMRDILLLGNKYSGKSIELMTREDLVRAINTGGYIVSMNVQG